MSQKKSAPNPGSGRPKRPNSLKEALAAHARAAKQSLLLRDRRECLGLSRLRQLAQRSVYDPPASTAEVKHLKLCRTNCAVTIRTMQSPLGTLPSEIFKKKFVGI